MMQTNQLGTTSIKKIFFQLTIPAVVAQLVNLLYNMVDRMYIGRIKDIGPLALTGVGVSMPIIMLVAAFAVLIGAGGAPRASILMGAGKRQEAEKILNNCAAALAVLGLVLTVLFYTFKEKLLIAFGASDQSLVYALEYTGIYILGSIAVMITLGLNYFISAQGFATTSMKTTLIGAGLNIVLDPIFIFGLKMGVKGAALATIISQTISCIWVLLFLMGPKTVLKIKKSSLELSSKVMAPVLALGFSPFIMHSTESLLQITFNTSLAKYGGDLYVGTMAINAILMQFVWLPLAGFTQGATPIISYNYGAKNKDRVKDTIKLLIKTCLIYSVTLFIFIQVFPGLFINLFTKDAKLFEATSWTLRIYAGGIFLLGIQAACQQSFIAFGQARTSVFLALFRKIVMLIPLIYFLPHILPNAVQAVYIAEPIADIVAALV
ncbi:MAG: MATE family efflux transporter, partial [Tissierellia bacterium]|nr:MATE family efflux transporter [Tissierellia bacterium]